MSVRSTRILQVGSIKPPDVDSETDLSEWFVNSGVSSTEEGRSLLLAAQALQQSSIPVAFPTETVYGLGADSTRSDVVQGIYEAKGRPADNPLIVHIGSLRQLRTLLSYQPGTRLSMNHKLQSEVNGLAQDRISLSEQPIPAIYRPLIERFWPGPLTILLRLPNPSPLAPEVSAGLSTVGVRMPASPLARLIISLADRPIAAPSANASSKPSPTTAQHVLHDLNGRIDFILDGGPCTVGVESTVVDGLSNPPAILRPGGVGIDQIRAIGGEWANITIGYRDGSQGIALANDDLAPRAPGMKYRHYAPKGKVVLSEAGSSAGEARSWLLREVGLSEHGAVSLKIGILRTRLWPEFVDLETANRGPSQDGGLQASLGTKDDAKHGRVILWDIQLGRDVESIARNLFSALRTLDLWACDIIVIEGVNDTSDDLAAAVMNRLRKAAELIIKGPHFGA